MNDIDTLNNIEAQDEDGNKDLLLRNSRNRGIKKVDGEDRFSQLFTIYLNDLDKGTEGRVAKCVYDPKERTESNL